MSNTDLNRKCWIAAAVIGLLVWLFTAGFGDLSLFAGLVLGVITTALLGVFLVWITRGWAQFSDDLDWHNPAERQPLMPEPALSTDSGDQPAHTHAEQIAPAGDAQIPDSGGERSVPSRHDIYGKTSDQGEAEPKPSAGTLRDDKALNSSRAADDRKDADADDLKEIKGVGPKLEELLHENGVTRFSQIAEWSDADIDHFAELIGRMGGRIRSDDWVEQARILAAGGETEFSKRVEKGGVYA